MNTVLNKIVQAKWTMFHSEAINLNSYVKADFILS